MATNKRKTTTAIVAGVTAVALLLGGTFAWTSISQQAKNETAGIVNVGGRLHDDFDGKNKDVYVENFTDPLNGGQPIYARVRLDEYMEVGKDAGGIDVDDDGTIDAVPVITGTDRDDVKTWTPHVPTESCETCTSGNTCAIHDHWKWIMGGQAEGSDGSTIFMPTFNKDKDSLAADINGTYAGTDDTDKIYYDDYVEYTTDSTTGGVGVAEDAKEAYDGKIYSIIGTEIYDNDTDTDDNGGVREVAGVTHTAKQTSIGSVILMDDWDGTPGNYWVYDSDGWAYWANPIMPGEATGLLLDGINMTKNPGEKCYYAINVVAQFATVGDWEYFDGTEENGVFDGTPEAEKLLETVSKNVATVTVTSDASVVVPGSSLQFNATVSQGDVSSANDPAFEWSLYNADGTAYTGNSTIDTNGLLTVAEDEAEGTILTVVARSTEYPGAVGMKSVTIEKPDVAVSITAANQLTFYDAGTAYTETLTAAVTGEEAVDGTITWSVADENGNALTNTTMQANGNSAELSISSSETVNQIVVSAKYKLQNGYEATATYVVARNRNIETTDDLSATPYAVLTKSAPDSEYYQLSFVRTNDTITENVDTLNNVVIEEVFSGNDTDFENKGIYYTSLPWYSYRSQIASVNFVNKIRPVETAWWFYEFTNCTEMNLANLDISNSSTTHSMFNGCAKLTTLDVSGFDTENVEEMTFMFRDCSELVSIKFGEKWNTSKVTTFWAMFSGCNKLTSISDLSGWDVSSATETAFMFQDCYALTTVGDLSGWNVSNVEEMQCMFENCYVLETVGDLTKWDVSKVTTYSSFNTNAPNVITPNWVNS